MIRYEFFNPWVGDRVSHFVYLKLDNLGRIIVLIDRCKSLSLFQLLNVTRETSDPLNGFLDSLSLIKLLL